MRTYDSIIVGGGPAGLSAAIYLARAMRSVLVIDRGHGRAAGKQINENYLGFPKGIKASHLLELGKIQAKKFHVEFADDKVGTIKKSAKAFSIKGEKASYKSRTLILCTGVRDHFPSFSGWETYLGKSLFWCIVCDGYKVRNKKLAIIGHDDKAVRTATQFINYTDKITFITNCDHGGDCISKRGLARLKKAKIKFNCGIIRKVHGKAGMMKKVELDSGEVIEADFMFNKQAYGPNSELAASLGAIIEGEGFIKVDINQRSNIPHLYAAGDVTSDSSHQIVTAAHEGSIAAISANEDLLLPFQKEE